MANHRKHSRVNTRGWLEILLNSARPRNNVACGNSVPARITPQCRRSSVAGYVISRGGSTGRTRLQTARKWLSRQMELNKFNLQLRKGSDSEDRGRKELVAYVFNLSAARQNDSWICNDETNRHLHPQRRDKLISKSVCQHSHPPTT